MKNFTFPFILLLCGVVLASCSTAYQSVDTEKYRKETNLSYGNHRKQKMDIYKPWVVKDSTPVVMLIHGGSWKHGGKWMLRPIQRMLAKEGIASVNIDYRLVYKRRNIQAQFEDLAAALKASDSIFKPKGKYLLLGESAGGHLAMMYGYRNSDKIEKIISLSGPTMLTGEDYIQSFKSVVAIPLLNKVTGTRYSKKIGLPKAYSELSPINNITNVPTLMVHGNLDYLVNIRQARKMDSALTKRNIPHELIVMRGAGHVGRINPYFRNKFVYPAIKRWVLSPVGGADSTIHFTNKPTKPSSEN